MEICSSIHRVVSDKLFASKPNAERPTEPTFISLFAGIDSGLFSHIFHVGGVAKRMRETMTFDGVSIISMDGQADGHASPEHTH